MMLTGAYDYLTPPSAGKEAADQIEGGTFIAMNDIGHFPMSENCPVFKTYLKQALEFIANRKEGAGPQTSGKSKNGKQQRSTREVRHGHPVHQ